MRIQRHHPDFQVSSHLHTNSTDISRKRKVTSSLQHLELFNNVVSAEGVGLCVNARTVKCKGWGRNITQELPKFAPKDGGNP